MRELAQMERACAMGERSEALRHGPRSLTIEE